LGVGEPRNLRVATPRLAAATANTDSERLVARTRVKECFICRSCEDYVLSSGDTT
jgi:hypothetical protein